jgi:D-tyrosyl-tRNA(Tyr) deacylase
LIALLQRVSRASVAVEGTLIGQIGAGLLVLLCAEPADTEREADKMLAKILKLRIFGDADGKMNRSVQDISGGLLVVSQFTLAADTSSGNRPGFTKAAPPEHGLRMYQYFLDIARASHPVVQNGQFGAEMEVALVNDGPVTIPLRIEAQQAVQAS